MIQPPRPHDRGRQQRADFEHERGRVDRLIGALIDRATTREVSGG